QVTQLLNQLTIEFGPKSAQLLDGVLLPFIRRTYQLIPGAGSSTAAADSPPLATSGAGNGLRNGSESALGEGPGPGTSSTGVWGRVNSGGSLNGTAFGGEGGGSGGVEETQQQLLAHEVAERSGIQKLYFSVLQHLASNGLAGVLSSPANRSHLDTILQSVLAGLSGTDDAATKKTCVYIFSLLLGGFNRGRSGGRAPDSPSATAANSVAVANGGRGASAGGTKAARAAATQRRALSGKGGGLWTGSGPTVDMEPSVRVGVTAFVLEKAVPAALRCLVDRGPAGLDLRDATAVTATVHMGTLLMEGKLASGGSAGFVGAAAVACECTLQVAEQLQQAVEGAVDGAAVATALKAFSQHVRPAR
ncbi:unnamed protein product, partial [Sphacelaria rigidula]